ncbi:unnamed protein product [Cuscuta campestris]|uniref:Uncharacterized protein n=1 Tax=Cuscuta campestris TaxID=132261 RepID=A0A484MC59_9ASTE|nr:unnamed protein product [Cuscuta campestris]
MPPLAMTAVTWLSSPSALPRPPKPLFRGRHNAAAHVVKAAKWPRASSVGFASLRGERLLRFSTLHRGRRISLPAADSGGDGLVSTDGDDEVQWRRSLQAILWIAEGVYVIWLFLLPYAPGDPIWAISSDTVNHLVALSLNFFLILPLLNNGLFLFYRLPHNLTYA